MKVQTCKENKDTANTLKQTLNERIFKEDALDVYFPLVRQGDYKLLFDAKVEDLEGNVTKEQVFLMFPSKAERDSFVETLEGDENVFQKSIETFKGDLIDVKRFESPPNGSFVAEVLDILKVKGVDDTISEEVLKLFIDRLPETSFAKSFLARKGTPGYIQEVEVAMADKGYTLAPQVGKLVGSAKVRAVMRSIEKQAKKIKGDSSEQAKEMVKVASERANFALHGAKNKGAEKWYKNMNQAAFLYTIGGNLSSALVNLSQIPLVVIPMLSGRFGLQESIDAFTEATSLVSASNITLKEYYTQTGKGMEARFTVKEEVKENVITIDGQEFTEKSLSYSSKYLIAQIKDLEVQQSNLQFQMDQKLAALGVMRAKLAESLKPEEEVEELAS